MAGPALKLNIRSVITFSLFRSSAFRRGLSPNTSRLKAELQTHFLSPKAFRKAIPAMRAISDRGASRSTDSGVQAGGGTLPKSTMSSVTIEIIPSNCSVVAFAARLRNSTAPLIGYIANDRFKLDLRTIFPQQDDLVIQAISAACRK